MKYYLCKPKTIHSERVEFIHRKISLLKTFQTGRSEGLESQGLNRVISGDR